MVQSLFCAYEASGSNPVGYFLFYFIFFIILLGTQTELSRGICQHQLSFVKRTSAVYIGAALPRWAATEVLHSF